MAQKLTKKHNILPQTLSGGKMRIKNTIVKKQTTLFFLIFCIAYSWGQNTDFNKIVPDETSRPKTFEDYLVQLAWNNSPQSKILNSEQQIAELDVDLQKRVWMKNLQAQWNLNEISLSNIIYDFEDPLFVAMPIWNVTASVDLDLVLNRKKRIQSSKQKVEIAKQSVDLYKLNLRALVLDRYYEYKGALKLFKIHTEAEQNAKDNYLLLRELFQEDKAEFEDLQRASQAYTNAQASKVQTETDIKKTKAALEELIGVKYEDAEKYGSSYKQE